MAITLTVDTGNGKTLQTETVTIPHQCINAMKLAGIDFETWAGSTANSKKTELKNGIRTMLNGMATYQAAIPNNQVNVYTFLVPHLCKVLELFETHTSAKISVTLLIA